MSLGNLSGAVYFTADERAQRLGDMLPEALQLVDRRGAMTAKVEKIAEQVRALPEDEREEFLSWLADFEVEHVDDWDREIARDSQPGGRLERVLGRVRKDITEGRTKPLDEVLDNS